jgi:hypothetical protein
MKSEQSNGWKILGSMAVALALGAGASAQRAGGEGTSRTVHGRPVIEVSLEDDLRSADLVNRGKIELDSPRELELTLTMRPRAHSNPLAIIPTLVEMEMTVVVSNGTPGGKVVINLDNRATAETGGGRARVFGEFDLDGYFLAPIPADVDVGGMFAQAEELWFGLVKKDAAGSAARRIEAPISLLVDLGEAAEEAYHKWWLYFTDLQIRHEARMRGELVEEYSAELLAAASLPVGGRRAADKIELARPREPEFGGGGHAQQGSEPEGSESNELEPPQGGQRAGEKFPLERPVHQDGHVLEQR